MMTPSTPIRSRSSIVVRLAPVGLAAALLLSACSSPSATSANAAPPAAATTTTSSSAASTTGASSGAVAGSSTTVQKVNANTASQAEVQAALQAAGVPNAARWSQEVVEYRPYPTDDLSFGKLRQNLAKYNPAPGVVDQIVATLSLS
jgi:hypothetical protein